MAPHRISGPGASRDTLEPARLDAIFKRENILSGNQFFGFLVPVLRTNRRNAKVAGADEFVERATTQAEVSCGIADLKHIGSGDSLPAIPAYLFDDVLGPTVFLQLAKDLLPLIIGELWARL